MNNYNNCTNNVKNNAILLAKQLDKLREEYGQPLLITSWYRPENINRAVGGVKGSKHTLGIAADVRPADGDVRRFEKWVDARWNMSLGWGSKKGFVHLDLSRPGQRVRWNY